MDDDDDDDFEIPADLRERMEPYYQERSELATQMLQHIATQYGHGTLDEIDDTTRDALEKEIEELTVNWNVADVKNINLKPSTELQHLLEKYRLAGEWIVDIQDEAQERYWDEHPEVDPRKSDTDD